jgi:hypothetical protein
MTMHDDDARDNDDNDGCHALSTHDHVDGRRRRARCEAGRRTHDNDDDDRR